MDTDPSFQTDTISEEASFSEEEFISKQQEKRPLFPFWMSFLLVLSVLLLGGMGVRSYIGKLYLFLMLVKG
jgi:hypothetical protein